MVEGRSLGLARAFPSASAIEDADRPLRTLVDRYLDQIETLKKPKTHRKYKAVLHRFADRFPGGSYSIQDTRRQLLAGQRAFLDRLLEKVR